VLLIALVLGYSYSAVRYSVLACTGTHNKKSMDERQVCFHRPRRNSFCRGVGRKGASLTRASAGRAELARPAGSAQFGMVYCCGRNFARLARNWHNLPMYISSNFIGIALVAFSGQACVLRSATRDLVRKPVGGCLDPVYIYRVCKLVIDTLYYAQLVLNRFSAAETLCVLACAVHVRFGR
jgi:hypothetical protein